MGFDEDDDTFGLAHLSRSPVNYAASQTGGHEGVTYHKLCSSFSKDL